MDGWIDGGYEICLTIYIVFVARDALSSLLSTGDGNVSRIGLSFGRPGLVMLNALEQSPSFGRVEHLPGNES